MNALMAWWQIGVLAALILALAGAAAVLHGRGHRLLFLLPLAMAGAATWLTIGLMLGGIAPGRTELMLPASSGLVPQENEALRLERHIYEMLAQRHPEAKAKIAEIERLREAGDEMRLAEARRALLAAYLPIYAPRTSDAAIRDFAAVMTENLEILLARDPMLCREVAAGRTAAVADHLNTPAAAAMNAVLSSAMVAPQKPPDAAEAIAIRRGVIDALYATGDPALVERPLLGRSAQAPAEAYCRTFIRVFRGILALPPDQGGKVLRFYYGQEGGSG